MNSATMKRWISEKTIRGEMVSLLPMSSEHAEAIIEAASDGRLWELWYTGVPSPSSIEEYITFALKEYEAERALPYVVIENATGKIIGSTRYLNVVPNHKRLEIGNTWYSLRFQRTPVNTECKLLLLTHAFDYLKAIAVEFRTHWHNHNSRNAILRLGAKQDGILRNHQVGTDGIYRDTVVFSIIENEWPAVKKSLSFKLSNWKGFA